MTVNITELLARRVFAADTVAIHLYGPLSTATGRFAEALVVHDGLILASPASRPALFAHRCLAEGAKNPVS